MGLILYLLKRLVRIVVALVAVSAMTFGLLHLAPGNFADISRITSGASDINPGEASETIAAFQARYGSDVPIWKQYLIFMKGAATFDFGPSYKYPDQTVQGIIVSAFPVSAFLALSAVIVALLIALPLGIFTAVKQNTKWDYGALFVITFGNSIPNFVAAVVLIVIFAAVLHVLPVRGWSVPQDAVLPIASLAIGPAAVLTRYIRSAVLETLREEYVIAARAKGGPPWIILTRHVLRNSLIPLVTVLGPLVAVLSTGTVFVESMFGIPGLGQYLALAAATRDMPLLMGTTLCFAAILMGMNLLVDLAYGAIDPRMRIQGAQLGWRRSSASLH